jgi:tRNA (guanine37-N1)-methyltransferase
MIFDVLTLFPDMFAAFDYSILKRARDKGLVTMNLYNIRDYTTNKHRKVDDYPYGGGAGMVMQAEPVYNAVDHVKELYGCKPYTILMSPRGKRFTQEDAKRLSSMGQLLFICGHYEGLDERISPLVDEELSLGDFVLTGGELACMTMIDSICRMVPQVLSSAESFEEESFYSGLLEYPQYTRPEEFRGMKVPEVLLSGDHEKVRQWRRGKSLKLTLERRPDLLKTYSITCEDEKLLRFLKEYEEEK